MPYFTYDQNNPGGVFHYSELAGISNFVIVEAGSAGEADQRAEEIGLYFAGDDACDCCGPRWHEMCESLAESEPMISGKPVDRYGLILPQLRSGHYLAFVHHMDGRVTGHLPG